MDNIDREKILYESFIDRISDVYNNNSLLLNMSILSDYESIMREKLEDERDPNEFGPYRHQYRLEVSAEKMKRYMINNVAEYRKVGKYELFVRLKNGEKFIYDDWYETIKLIKHETEDLTEEQEKEEFVKNLRKLMGHKRITQEELAEKVGTSQQMIGRYVNGLAFPGGMMLRKISKVLDCSIDDLFYKHY